MDQLAIHGGKPVVQRGPGKPWPIFGMEEQVAAANVAASGRWWRGASGDPPPQTDLFEQAFARFQDARFGVAVSSGTAGLLCALRAIYLQPGDEVIVPPCTFPSPVMAVLECGATPVFADITPDNYTIDPGAVEAALSPKTKAIIGVDYGGHPCDMDALTVIAERNDISLINDCAHAHGSQWRGRGVGAIGHMGVFSFQGSKLLPCGEGGMLLTDNEQLATVAFAYQHAGRLRPVGAILPRPTLTANLRMSEWQAAIGLVQLSRLAEQVSHREANALYLSSLLEQIPGIENLKRDPRVTRQGFYFWSFKVDVQRLGISRDLFVKALQAEGVPCFTGQTRPAYHHPIFQVEKARVTPCPHAEKASAESVAISHPYFLGEREDMDLIATAVNKIIVHFGVQ